MKQGLIVAVALFAAAGCAGGSGRAAGPRPEVAADTGSAPTARLARALQAETWGPLQSATLAQLDSAIGRPAVDFLLAQAAADTAAGRDTRANAILQLGDRRAGGQLAALRVAARDPDPVLRASVMYALGQVVEVAEAPALLMLRAGLSDPDELVRAKALQSLGERDPEALRQFLAGDPSEQLRTVAADLLNLALQRGAPWGDSAAVDVGEELSRTTTSGVRLRYRPTRTWDFQASVGELWVERPGAAPRRVARDVEAVAGAVPAILSPDEKWLAFEAARRIHVMELATGAVREVGAGIAPRPLPFAPRFVYLVERPEKRVDQSRSTMLHYDVLMTSFEEAGPPKGVGTIGAASRMERWGGYSSARLVRVRELGGDFVLRVPQGGELVLPDAFGGPGDGGG